MQSTPKIIVLARSIAWQSVLQHSFERNFSSENVCWTLDIDDFLLEVQRSDDPTAIVELTAGTLGADCRKIGFIAKNTPQTRFFAVGNNRLNDCLPWIRVFGFVDACSSLSQLPKLVNLIHNQIRTRPTVDLTIEEWVEENLPWPSDQYLSPKQS